jgi:hypothetical protein
MLQALPFDFHALQYSVLANIGPSCLYVGPKSRSDYQLEAGGIFVSSEVSRCSGVAVGIDFYCRGKLTGIILNSWPKHPIH